MKQHNDGLDELREQSLRDPSQHAHALFSIESEVKDLGLCVTQIADCVEEHQAESKQRYDDLSGYLLNGPHNSLPEIARSLRHIKALIAVLVFLLIVNLLK